MQILFLETLLSMQDRKTKANLQFLKWPRFPPTRRELNFEHLLKVILKEEKHVLILIMIIGAHGKYHSFVSIYKSSHSPKEYLIFSHIFMAELCAHSTQSISHLLHTITRFLQILGHGYCLSSVKMSCSPVLTLCFSRRCYTVIHTVHLWVSNLTLYSSSGHY